MLYISLLLFVNHVNTLSLLCKPKLSTVVEGKEKVEPSNPLHGQQVIDLGGRVIQCCNVRFSHRTDRPIYSIRNAVALLGPYVVRTTTMKLRQNRNMQ